MKKNKKPAFKAGMFLLETLTSGMYNDSLSIYREYIQNAADSIDIGLKENRKRPQKTIYIDLDPFEKSVTISDEGAGISSNIAETILSSVGLSPKKESKLRGFRGIGRLGGLAFCEQATFRTKARNEVVESIQEWDCNKLRTLMTEKGKETFSIEELFNECTNFYQRNGKPKKKSYFEVKLEGVQSFRNHIMDIKKISNFIGVVAPVPFNPNEFSYGEKINDYLASTLTNYSEYEVMLNGEPIYKPYRDQVKLSTKGFDEIENVEFFDIKLNGASVAHGWYGKRKSMVGAITKGEQSSGIRVRVGNIQIGDNHLLDGCFRENRFNSYMMGEIHVDCPELIPNSRRDDFVDNESKGLFYNEIERVIGLPFSKEIRKQSRLGSKDKTSVKNSQKSDSSSSSALAPAEPSHKRNPIEKTGKSSSQQDSNLRQVLEKQCKGCPVFEKLIRENT